MCETHIYHPKALAATGAALNELEPDTQISTPSELATPNSVASESSADREIFTVPSPTLHSLFIGDDGLRAGWSVLLYLLIVAAIGVAIRVGVMHFHLLPKADPKLAQTRESSFAITAAGEATLFFALALAAWFMSLIERRPFGRYGLTTRRMPSDIAIGFCWGLLCLSILVGAMILTHSLAFDGLLLHGTEALKDGAKWFLGFLLVGLFEEFLFRGYLQYTVARGVAGIARAMSPTSRHIFQWGFWIAAFFFSGMLFMVAHTGNAGETFAGIVSVGLAGAVFAFSLYRTGSLWWAIGFHTAWDWAQSFVYGVFDSGTMVQGHLLASHPIGKTMLSGGNDGPEGSLLCIPTFVLIFAIIHFTLPKRDYPLTPDQSPITTSPDI